MDPKETFYFLRHGQTDSNVGGVYSNNANPPLNSLGKEQAVDPSVSFVEEVFREKE